MTRLLFQQLGQLVRQDGEDFLFHFRFGQLPVRFQHHAHALGGFGRLAGVLLEADGQGADDEGGSQHNEERHGVARFIGVDRKARCGEQKVEEQHAHDGPHHAVRPMGGAHGHRQQPQQIDHDDIGVGKPQMGEQETDGRAHAHGGKEHRAVQQQPLPVEFGRLPGHVGFGAVIGNDVIIQVRGVSHQTVRQRFFSPQKTAYRVGLADHHAGNIGQPGVFRDLVGHVVPDHRIQLRAKLLR